MSSFQKRSPIKQIGNVSCNSIAHLCLYWVVREQKQRSRSDAGTNAINPAYGRSFFQGCMVAVWLCILWNMNSRQVRDADSNFTCTPDKYQSNSTTSSKLLAKEQKCKYTCWLGEVSSHLWVTSLIGESAKVIKNYSSLLVACRAGLSRRSYLSRFGDGSIF